MQTNFFKFQNGERKPKLLNTCNKNFGYLSGQYRDVAEHSNNSKNTENVWRLSLARGRQFRYILFKVMLLKALPISQCLKDIITLYTACFMHNFHNSKIPYAFSSFFTSIRRIYNYNTRLASKSTFVLPKVRTNYAGKIQYSLFWSKRLEGNRRATVQCH